MNLLVTGGAGFIGSNYLHSVAAGDPAIRRLVNLDALTYAGHQANLRGLERDARYVFVHGNIADEALVDRLLREHAIDAVAHFAAESHVDRSIDSPEPFFQTNVIGTLRLFNAVRRYWKELPESRRAGFRLLHVSTDEVFGSLGPQDPPFSETTPFAPNSPYAASKAASDHVVRAFHHTYGLPVLISNCSNNYGPRQFPEKLIPLMTLNALEGRPLPIYGDGLNVRDWLYVEDHARALHAILRGGRPGETYNVGGGCERTNIQIVDALCAILDQERPRANGAKHSALKTFVPDRPGHDRRYAINHGKIFHELGWQPRETFETGLQRTVRWYLDNVDWLGEVTHQRYDRQRLGLSV